MTSGEEKRTKALRCRTKQGRVIVVHQGASYDVTEFLDKHPGGRDVILGYAGRSVTKAMCDSSIHMHSEAAYSILETHKVICQSSGKHLPKSRRTNVNELTGWKEQDMILYEYAANLVKKPCPWNEQQLAPLLQEISCGSFVNPAAEKYGIPESMICGKIELDTGDAGKVPGRKPVFSPTKETELSNCLSIVCNELVDWDKPMLAQVHKLGPEYMNWVHSPVDFKLRLFESQFVEFFSKTPWYIIPIVWIPVVMYFSLSSAVKLQSSVSNSGFWFVNGIGSLPLAAFFFCACFAFGILVWSFLEYILHRYLFHLTPPPNSPFWITLHFFLHGQHHKVPFDGDRLVFPPAAAAVFAVLFYFALTTMLPVCIGQALFAGGLLGYVIYDLTHYYLHHGSPLKNSYLDKLKQYHVAHHFMNQSKGFGISSKLWDFPFGTLP